MEESGLFPLTLVNSDLYTITYTPNLDVSTNKYSGDGMGVDGPRLETLSSSALAEYIKGGTYSNPNRTHYWTNENSAGYSWFDITFNRNYIYPVVSGEIQVGMKASGVVGLSYTVISELNLWAKQSLNPALASDVLIGTVTPDTYAMFGETGELIEYTFPATINEGNRLSWEVGMPGLYLSASGKLLFFSAIASGTDAYTGMEITLSGLLTNDGLSSSNTSIDLYTAGHIANTGSLDMYTISYLPATSGLDLYLMGGLRSSGNFDMFTMAGVSQSTFEMYEGGHITNSGNFNLYIQGHSPSSGNMDLYLWGHQDSTSSFNLFLKSPATGTSLSGTDMYTLGPSQLPYSGILPMVVYFDSTPVKSFDMFLQNTAISGAQSINMFLQAPSGTYGAVPWSGVLPLYIARDSEAVDAGISIFISGPNSLASGVDLYISGTNSLTESLNMSISGGGPVNQSINLFAHGF